MQAASHQSAVVTFHLFVTGKSEQAALCALLEPIVEDLAKGQTAICFQQSALIPQFSPRIENLPSLRVTGTHKQIPTALEEKVTLPVQALLRQDPHCFVLLVDDLERRRADKAQEVFANYRAALDKALDTAELRRRAAVHFFVNMLEAYYFADPAVVNEVLSINLTEPVGDVEDINNPKIELKNRVKHLGQERSFNEVEHGKAIAQKLSLDRVLANPKTCRALRTLVGWCRHRLGAAFDQRWRLVDGAFHPVTCGQIPWRADAASG